MTSGTSGNMSGFNWSEVPTIILEMGLLSNAQDEKLLTTPEYQNKIVDGIVAGTLLYLGN